MAKRKSRPDTASFVIRPSHRRHLERLAKERDRSVSAILRAILDRETANGKVRA